MYLHTYVRTCTIICMYSGTCTIQHPLGNEKNSAGLAGCGIIEVRLCGENQRSVPENLGRFRPMLVC